MATLRYGSLLLGMFYGATYAWDALQGGYVFVVDGAMVPVMKVRIWKMGTSLAVVNKNLQILEREHLANSSTSNNLNNTRN